MLAQRRLPRPCVPEQPAATRDAAAFPSCAAPAETPEAAPTVRVSALQSFFHPSGHVSVFKIEWNGKSIVYATDTEERQAETCA